jgi:hypothetical protein
MPGRTGGHKCPVSRIFLKFSRFERFRERCREQFREQPALEWPQTNGYESFVRRRREMAEKDGAQKEVDRERAKEND